MFHLNMKAIIPDWDLSIKEGGIAPLGEERQAYVFKQVQQVAKKYRISLDKPLKELPHSALNVLLYGKEDAAENDTVEFDLNELIITENEEGEHIAVKEYY